MSLKFGPEAVKDNKVVIIDHNPVWDDFETIERKGIGHPDTIADALASLISQSYCRYTIKNCEGLILHHQIDKLMIIGGKTKVRFGKGNFINPIKIIIAGRATYSYKELSIPVNRIINTTIRRYFKDKFPLVNLEKDVIVENLLTDYAGPGTLISSKGAIANMFSPKSKLQVRGYEKLIANDTSYCVAYAPYSKLERSIIKLENYLNNKSSKKKYPWLGSDIKIMAVRNYNEVDITLCIPQIAKYVKSLVEYKNNLVVIGNVIKKRLELSLPKHILNLSINTKDDFGKMNIYLTVSGASLSGDIGVVGRGNRTNGLITSNRPMSLEGTNGKNPRYYSGFVYAVASKKIANQLYKLTGKPNIVEIVSQNGGLLKKPWRIRIISSAEKRKILKVVDKNLNNIENFTMEFVNGKSKNY